METIQAHNLGYATGLRIGLRNSQADGVKTASAQDLHTKVGGFVLRHGVRLEKRAARIKALYDAIVG